uniref:Uncharacterized protein n=1 Tax=Oryza sativa subsp. japonica TaxID=39947 RepID=Q6K3B0_ORYSJ|nr:hypothetical protein [Oryza sativa Japonica Group]BAD19991.1 hypothetical protein [Oryza sativa Japonica Group]
MERRNVVVFMPFLICGDEGHGHRRPYQINRPCDSCHWKTTIKEEQMGNQPSIL